MTFSILHCISQCCVCYTFSVFATDKRGTMCNYYIVSLSCVSLLQFFIDFSRTFCMLLLRSLRVVDTDKRNNAQLFLFVSFSVHALASPSPPSSSALPTTPGTSSSKSLHQGSYSVRQSVSQSVSRLSLLVSIPAIDAFVSLCLLFFLLALCVCVCFAFRSVRGTSAPRI